MDISLNYQRYGGRNLCWVGAWVWRLSKSSGIFMMELRSVRCRVTSTGATFFGTPRVIWPLNVIKTFDPITILFSPQTIKSNKKCHKCRRVKLVMGADPNLSDFLRVKLIRQVSLSDFQCLLMFYNRDSGAKWH